MAAWRQLASTAQKELLRGMDNCTDVEEKP
jgi:hypothetical protein